MTGVYQVNSVVGGAPCGNDQPVAGYAPYLKFHHEEFFGRPYVAYDGCTDATAMECNEIGGLFGGFYKAHDTGWSGETSIALSDGSNCILAYQYQRADLSGANLTIDVSMYREEVPGNEQTCTAEEATRRGKNMPCVQHQLTEAVKVD